jgi:uncharacterized membrane protein YdbT with pleckstrin-like domain
MPLEGRWIGDIGPGATRVGRLCENLVGRRTMEGVLYTAHPSMFRNRPISFLLCVAAIPAWGLGLVVLLIWWFRTLGTTLIVTDRRTVLRRGLFSKYTSEVMHRDVRNVQLGQTSFQRILGVGAVGISSSG